MYILFNNAFNLHSSFFLKPFKYRILLVFAIGYMYGAMMF